MSNWIGIQFSNRREGTSLLRTPKSSADGLVYMFTADHLLPLACPEAAASFFFCACVLKYVAI